MNSPVLRQFFAQPQALWLYLVLPALSILAFFATRHRRRVLGRLGRLPALAALTERRRSWRALRSFVWFTAMTTLLVGIAGPQWGREPEMSTAPGRDLTVVLDVSRSMLADDVAPSRQEKGKQALRELIGALKRRGGNRVALVAFAARADILCPLTHDYDHFLHKLDDIDAGHLPLELRPDKDTYSGTRFGAGLRAALDAQDPRPERRGFQDVLFITDGDDPTHGQLSELDPEREKEWREALKALEKAGIPVHTVGLGDPVNGGKIPDGAYYLSRKGELVISKLDDRPLKVMSERTKATCTLAGTDPPRLVELFRNRIDNADKQEVSDDALPQYRQRYAWFFGAALFLICADLVVGRTLRNKSVSVKVKPVGKSRPPALAGAAGS